MQNNNDLEREEIEQYKPGLRMMTNFTLIVMWILIIVFIWWTGAQITGATLLIGLAGFATFTAKYTPAIVKLNSPFLISRLHADSIKSNDPIKTFPAIPGRPPMGVFYPGAVDAPHLAVSTYVGTKQFIIVPVRLGMKRGRNLDINCVTADYTDHTQLPPDIYEGIQELSEYKPDMHIEYGLWPEDWYSLSEKDKADFKDSLKYIIETEHSLGKVPEVLLDKLFLKMDEMANTVSPFKYDASLTAIETNFAVRENTLNHQVIELTAIIRQWESMYAKLMKTSNPPTVPRPPGAMEKLSNMAGPEQDRGGGQSG